MKNIKIVGIVGSLRKESYNKKIMLAIKELLPNNITLELADISTIPLFNEDLEKDIPKTVTEFNSLIASADAIIIATAEYNYSIPGVLKNALDWASRAKNKPLVGKQTAIISASLGFLGGARAQYHLRQVCVALDMNLLNNPEVFIGSAHTKFNEDGILTDDKTKQVLTKLINKLINSIQK